MYWLMIGMLFFNMMSLTFSIRYAEPAEPRIDDGKVAVLDGGTPIPPRGTNDGGTPIPPRATNDGGTPIPPR